MAEDLRLTVVFSVRVLPEEPIIDSRSPHYLIDFITPISGVSYELAGLDSEPGMDSNFFIRPAITVHLPQSICQEVAISTRLG